MKSLICYFFATGILIAALNDTTAFAENVVCPATFSKPDSTAGGGGISGVGGGGLFMFSRILQTNIPSSEPMPHSVIIIQDVEKVATACVYDDFDQESPKLQTELRCIGGDTLDFPWDHVRLRCTGSMKLGRMDFEATILRKTVLGVLTRFLASGPADNEIVLLGGF